MFWSAPPCPSGTTLSSPQISQVSLACEFRRGRVDLPKSSPESQQRGRERHDVERIGRTALKSCCVRFPLREAAVSASGDCVIVPEEYYLHANREGEQGLYVERPRERSCPLARKSPVCYYVQNKQRIWRQSPQCRGLSEIHNMTLTSCLA